MNAIKITTELPPKELHPNARAGWPAKARVKKAHRQAVAADATIQTLQQIGHRPLCRHATISLYFEFPPPQRGGAKRHDPDNLIAWAKTTIDALTDAGVLADDREVTYAPPSQRTATRHEAQIYPRLHAGQLHITIAAHRDDRCPFCGHPHEPPQ